MHKLLTIVVPVYNVEPYINKGLDSLILEDANLMELLEVIIVNDGTPDRSAELSREYVKRYPKTFRQIDKENGGHGSAWNVGLKEATGKYLRFLDSDDWLTNLDKLLNNLQTTDVDVIVTQVSIFYAKENRIEVKDSFKDIDGREMPIESEKFGAGISNFWHSTYKLSILQPLHPLFLEGVSYDDTILCIVPHLMAKTFVAYDFVVYNYMQGRAGQSIDLKVVQRKMNDYFVNYRHLIDFIGKTRDGVTDMFVDEVVADYRRKLFNIASIIPDYKKSRCYIEEIKSLGSLDGIGCRDYGLYKRLPYRLFHHFARMKYNLKTTMRKAKYALKRN